MRRGWILVVLASTAACSRDWSFQVRDRDAAAGSGGVTGLDGGTCFPGAKACPDSTGKVICLAENSPVTGCKTSSCDSCVTPHATAACTPDGACSIGTCDAAWGDCNGDAVDGCEANLSADTTCGSCDNDCVAANGNNWICNQGTCEVNACCSAGPCSLRDCDGDKTNGCEADLSQDPNNCGACGTVCALSNASATCANSVCVVAQCNPGFADCDGNPANGCERNTSTDAANCGGCAKTCTATNAVAACVNGACQLACNSGYADCDNNPGNGCETSLSTDMSHCGSCATICALQHVSGGNCTAGVCGFVSCANAYGDCDGNPANGCETSLHTLTDCGACGTACTAPPNGTAACPIGNCSITCNTGYHACSGSCFATDDPTHCGFNCTNCPGPTAGTGTAICGGSTCSFQCTAPTSTKCGSGCYDLQTDKNHCGGCNMICTGGKNCVSGSCQ